MDKLQELEEKKRQLKELRERRRNHDGYVHLLQSVQALDNPMVSVSIQTDASEELEPSSVQAFAESKNEVITYEKGIQVDLIKEFQEIPSSVLTPAQFTPEEPPEPIEEPQLQEEAPSLPELTKLDPLVVEDQQNSIHNKSFSILEVLKESGHVSLASSSNNDFQFEHALTWDSKIMPHTESNTVCVSLDWHEQLMVVVFRSTPLQKFSTIAISWSHVRVFKWDTDQLIDSIDFRGQTLLGARFLRRKVNSNVISILLTTHTGKTMLYELTCTGGDRSKNIIRNLLIKNYHAHAIYAFDEYVDVPLGKERFLVASTNGVISELSSLDLSTYKDATANTQPIAQVVVEPPRASDICDLDKARNEEGNEEPDEARLQCFTDHLLRVALSDELAITSLTISPSNQDMLYLGTEDGGIYRIMLAEIDNNKIKLSKENHGFLPSESAPAFHSSHVVALTNNTQELLLSASLDWTCCLWDPKNNCKLSSLDVGTPILAVQWLEDNRSAILTCDAFLVVSWQISSYVDRHTRLQRFRCTAPPQIQSQLTSEDAQVGYFTCFKAFPATAPNVVAIGSNTSFVKFYHVPNVEEVLANG
ncbi:PAC11 (YDR488C) [Zygosaccharomyces parabailii]|nr:PAC11 (YDR488C) [Zygosaccharomyces parabailii]CDH12912.1 uncharacterized protein ZBAI_04698 [Zygosaccharomyces bailii ISA1307]